MPELSRHAEEIFRAGVDGVQPGKLLGRADWRRWLARPLADYRRVVLAAVGKGALPMAAALESALGERLEGGIATVPHGYLETLPAGIEMPRRVAVTTAGHPVPDAAGAEAAGRALALARGLSEGDLLIVAVSGGGSALWLRPVEGVTLEAVRETVGLLLKSGADIHAMNCVRKQLSAVGGGKLALAAWPAEVLALVVSDVIGDNLETIASGPTVRNPTTAGDALAVLEKLSIVEKVPAEVRAKLEELARENAIAGAEYFARVTTRLLGGNQDALAAAARKAEALGYKVELDARLVEGEAREAGREFAARLTQMARAGGGRRALVQGGETTVTVKGSGRGGRNQEFALAAALELERAGTAERVAILSAGSDGIDGPTDAAGAVVTETSATAARDSGLAPEEFLENNDAYAFFARAGGLIMTGPTHTNVMDIVIGLTGDES